jgi:hypothetical protein
MDGHVMDGKGFFYDDDKREKVGNALSIGLHGRGFGFFLYFPFSTTHVQCLSLPCQLTT